MPLYDYRCPICDTSFEARHGFNDPAPPCPECGAANPQRVILSMPAVHGGMNAHAGDSRRASKTQLQEKWAEETPNLREKLVSKLGEEAVNTYAPSLNTKYD